MSSTGSRYCLESNFTKHLLSFLSEYKVLLVLCFVTFVAGFDYAIFIYLADSLSLTFFAQTRDAFSHQLQLVGLFATGYMARPVGALLMGRYGDSKGRQPALHLGLWLLFITSLVAAALPTYAQVGVTASILLIIVRLIQGAAFANQFGLSWVYVAEDLPRRRLALYISFVCASMVFGGILCALLIAYINQVFTPEQTIANGWRIPFIFSACLGLTGYLLVRGFNETSLFTKYINKTKTIITKSSPIKKSLRPNAVFLTAVLAIIYTSTMIMFSFLLPKLVDREVSLDASSLRMINIIGMTSLTIGIVCYGKFADKFDVGRTLMIGALLLCVQTILFYYYLGNGNGAYLIPIYALVGFFNGFIGLCPSVFIQLYPTRVRLTAVNVIFNLMTVFTGIILPFSLLYITDIVSFAPAMYIIFICLCTFFIGFYVYQTPQLNDLKNDRQTRLL